MISMRTISSITEKNINRSLWLLFWQMKITTTEGDKTGPTAHVQLKDKKCKVFEDIFFWDTDE